MAWEGSEPLRQALKPRGKKAEFATRMDVHPSQVSRWIRGATPDEELWPHIEVAAGLPAGTLRRTNWRDEAALLQAQVDDLYQLVTKQSEQLANLLEAAPPPVPRPKPASPRRHRGTS